MVTPRVSIGLPVFNGERYVGAAIDSILAQTFTDFELIIADNASTDRTPEICRAYAAADPRVRYVRSEHNLGGSPNFNRVVDLAVAEYFRWAAHDDLIAPDWVRRCVEVMDGDPALVLCQTDVVEIDEHGAILGPELPRLRRLDAPSAPARFAELVLVNHQCSQAFGLVRTATMKRTPRLAPFIGSDRVLLAEFGLLGRFGRVPEPLFLVRQHAARSVRAVPLHQRAAWFDSAAHPALVFPHWRTWREYVRVVRRVCRRPADRWTCYWHLVRWPWHSFNWARLASDLLIAVWPASAGWLTATGRRLSRASG